MQKAKLLSYISSMKKLNLPLNSNQMQFLLIYAPRAFRLVGSFLL